MVLSSDSGHFYPCSVYIGKSSTDNQDKINQRPDTQSAKRKKHQETSTDFTHVKTMNSERAQKKAEQNCGDKAPFTDIEVVHRFYVSFCPG